MQVNGETGRGRKTMGTCLILANRQGIDAHLAIKEAQGAPGATVQDPEIRHERKTYTKPSSNGDRPLDENSLAIKWLIEERKLAPEIIKAFRISAFPERRAIVFPCYGPQGELINHSYRTLTRPGEK